jgi:hypothetical protein
MQFVDVPSGDSIGDVVRSYFGIKPDEEFEYPHSTFIGGLYKMEISRQDGEHLTYAYIDKDGKAWFEG